MARLERRRAWPSPAAASRQWAPPRRCGSSPDRPRARSRLDRADGGARLHRRARSPDRRRHDQPWSATSTPSSAQPTYGPVDLGLCGGAPRAIVDHRRWLVDVRLSGRHAAARGAGRAGARSAGDALQPRRARRVGQLRWPCNAPAWTPPPRTRQTAGSSAIRTARPPACCRKAPSTWWRTTCHRPATPIWWPGLLEGQRQLHALGITGWQDAIVRPEGRRRTRRCSGPAG